MSKNPAWESTIKPILVLGVSSLVVSLLLAIVNSFTAPVIAENERATTLAAYIQVLPGVAGAEDLEEVTDYTTPGVTGAVRAADGSIAVKAGESGFDGGIVTVIMGFDPTGTMTGLWVDATTQTSGIGTNITNEEFLSQFDGLTAASNIAAGAGYDNYSGATYSSNALFAAINDCINCYNELS